MANIIRRMNLQKQCRAGCGALIAYLEALLGDIPREEGVLRLE